LLGGWLILNKSRNPQTTGEALGENDSSTILFYGETCPHCHVVMNWLDENQEVKDAAGIVYKEVYKNYANSQNLIKKAKDCQINAKEGVGVPFLYDHGQCLIGDQPIIDYLSENYK